MTKQFFAEYDRVAVPVQAFSVADARAKWIAANPDKDARKLKIRKPLSSLQMGRR